MASQRFVDEMLRKQAVEQGEDPELAVSTPMRTPDSMPNGFGAAIPAAPAKKSIFDFDPEALKAEQDEVSSKKGMLGAIGALGDALSSRNSFGNYYLGKMNGPNNTASRMTGAVADSIKDPLEYQGKLYAAYKNSMEGKKLQEEEALLASRKDLNSNATKAARVIAQKFRPELDTSNMSAYDIDQIFDSKKMNEVEAQSQVNLKNQEALQDRGFEQQKKLKQMELDGDLAKARATEGAKAPTEGQSSAAVFAQRVENSEKVMQELFDKGFDGTDRRTWAQKKVWNEAKPVELQKAEQAQRNFINAVLRKESGAAIAPEEFENARQQYFPQAGDSAEVLEQKKQNRLDALAGLRAQAGDKALAAVRDRRGALDEQFAANPVRTVDPKKSKANLDLIPEAKASNQSPMVKEVNGKLYQKVKGGWEPL